MYDIVIKNGKIVDGTGNPWYAADVAIAGGHVVRVARGIDDGKVTIDAKDRAVSPGFIDAHTHSDFLLLADPRALSKVHQGVTTEVIGNCGGSFAPIAGPAVDHVKQQVSRYPNVTVDWTGTAGYLEKLERQGTAVNVVPLVGFGSARISVMGHAERPATPEERTQMRAHIEQGIEEGAFGMSTGLFYAPQSFAPTDEVIDVAKGLKPKEALYVSHIRDESDYTIGMGAALEEAFKIARAAGVPLHISHLHALGVATWKKAPEYVASIQKARDSGLDVTGDQYPYHASGGGITGSVMPRWALEGGRVKVLERLADKETRDRIAREVATNFTRRGGAFRHTFSQYRPNPEFEGMTVDKVAEILGEPPEYAALTLLEKGEASWVAQIIDEDDIITFLKAPWVMGGSDGSSLALTGPVSGGKPHPRNFGTFVRMVGTYARDKNIMPVHEIIRKVTSLPAQRFGLQGRGVLREGFWADVVVFDPLRIRDRATFKEPHQFADGIDYVLVNGQIVVDHDRHTGALPGKPLRR